MFSSNQYREEEESNKEEEGSAASYGFQATRPCADKYSRHARGETQGTSLHVYRPRSMMVVRFVSSSPLCLPCLRCKLFMRTVLLLFCKKTHGTLTAIVFSPCSDRRYWNLTCVTLVLLARTHAVNGQLAASSAALSGASSLLTWFHNFGCFRYSSSSLKRYCVCRDSHCVADHSKE